MGQSGTDLGVPWFLLVPPSKGSHCVLSPPGFVYTVSDKAYRGVTADEYA